MLIHKMFRNLRRCLNLKYPRNVHLLGGIRRASTKKSYIHNVGKSPLRHCTVGDAIEEAAHKWPGRPAVIDCHTNTTYTFAQLLDQADKLAAAFLEIGLESGDRVGIWAPNSAEWLVSYLACARAGLISVAINPVYAKPEVEYCLKKVDVKALVMPSVYKQTEYYTMLCDIVKELRSSERGQIKSRSLENLKSVIVLGDYNLPGTFNYGDLIHSSSSSRVDQVRRRTQYINPDSGCNMQFTSGTTADPKAALLSHQGIVNNGYFSGLRYEMDTCHQKLCVQVPLFHVFGVIVVCMSSLQHGATIVLPSPTYNANANLEALLMEKCTAVVGTPTMFVDLLTNLNSFNVTANVNWALTGGAPASPMLLNNIKKTLGAKSVKSIFGMTEMSGGMFESMPEEPAEKAYETAGRLLDHLEAKIVDEDGCIVPMGEPGELLVRGYCTLIEYWKDAEKTTAAIGKDGWLRTGDQVILSEDGYAKVAGRLKDVIIRGGENIYPKEIEDVIDSHPDVVESQVFGVPDERLGEEVSVAVRLRGGANMNVVTQNLHEFCKGKLAYFKIPRYVRVVEEFPKTTSGKIQRRKLKTLFSPEVDNTPKPCRISNKM